ELDILERLAGAGGVPAEAGVAGERDVPARGALGSHQCGLRAGGEPALHSRGGGVGHGLPASSDGGTRSDRRGTRFSFASGIQVLTDAEPRSRAAPVVRPGPAALQWPVPLPALRGVVPGAAAEERALAELGAAGVSFAVLGDV